MSVFVDTSALFAVLDADDLNHAAAKSTWARLLAQGDDLISTNYILLETFALVQRRLGMEAVKTFEQDIVRVLKIEWLDQTRHSSAVSRMLDGASKQVSLVDWSSFDAMWRLGIKTVFVFDQHFTAQGFECVPSETEQTT